MGRLIMSLADKSDDQIRGCQVPPAFGAGPRSHDYLGELTRRLTQSGNTCRYLTQITE